MTGDVRFVLEPIGSLSALQTHWRELDRSGTQAFFLTWSWIGAWLRTVPQNAWPLTIRLVRDGRVAGLALVGTQTRRHAGLTAKQAFLNAAGCREFDCVTLEHNGFAGMPFWPGLFEILADQCDEISIGGLAASIPPEAVPADLLHEERTTPAYRVGLAALTTPDGLESHLSRNARQQLRRNFRDCESLGPLTLDAAPDVQTALAYFSDLKELHIASWMRRGRQHAFEFPFFEAFHRDLIAAEFASGVIELLRIRAGAHALGYLYNFRHRGAIYAYQSGFDYAQESFRPGYVCHALALQRYAAAGAKIYDFMAGRNRLKETFAGETYAMTQHRFRRPLLRYRAEAAARKLLGR